MTSVLDVTVVNLVMDATWRKGNILDAVYIMEGANMRGEASVTGVTQVTGVTKLTRVIKVAKATKVTIVTGTRSNTWDWTWSPFVSKGARKDAPHGDAATKTKTKTKENWK